jgi:MFS superfamily sulfate permease-like transporter
MLIIEELLKIKTYAVLISIVITTWVSWWLQLDVRFVGDIPSGFPAGLAPWHLFTYPHMTGLIAITICAIMIPYCVMLIVVVV